MKYEQDCPVALTPAAPGWYVKASTDPDHSYPVAAWATVVQVYSEDGTHALTTVEPVFLHDGVMYTSSEWYEAMGQDNRIRVIAP